MHLEPGNQTESYFGSGSGTGTVKQISINYGNEYIEMIYVLLRK